MFRTNVAEKLKTHFVPNTFSLPVLRPSRQEIYAVASHRNKTFRLILIKFCIREHLASTLSLLRYF
jgi:hypothetical protein